MLYLRDQIMINISKTSRSEYIFFSRFVFAQQYIFYVAFSFAIILKLLSEFNITLEIESLWQRQRNSPKL